MEDNMRKEIIENLKKQNIDKLNDMQKEILKKAKNKDLVCISSTRKW